MDYQAQADRPFEHEERLKQLLTRQSELNSQLDLDKGDQQGADSPAEVGEDFDKGKAVAAADDHAQVAKMAEAYMRASGTAIREMPIVERPAPTTGSVSGRAVAKDGSQVAVATAANRFIVVDMITISRDVQIGDRLSLHFRQGRPSVERASGLTR